MILDLTLPDGNGLDVCAKIKQNPVTSKVPVMILTGSTSKEDRDKAIQAGASACMTKPFDPMELANEVSRLASSS